MSGLLQIVDAQFMVTVLVGISVFATILTVAMPLMTTDRLRARMKYVATEREVLRAKHREMLEKQRQQAKLRQTPKGYMQQLVESLNLRKLLETEDTRSKLRMAGLRSQAHLITFLFFRATMPFLFAGLAFIYLYFINSFGQPPLVRLLIIIGGAYLGFYLPNIFIANLIARRQESIKRAFSDALDLLLICVESGMSLEPALTRVAQEISEHSVYLAEELTLTTAELSYLQDRRKAFDNLGKRTGLQTVKAVVTSLIQAERYGTPLGTALRVLAQENRDMRMAEAEKKAAGLPPKLTVPMILFFLPVIFIVILGPAAIQLMNL